MSLFARLTFDVSQGVSFKNSVACHWYYFFISYSQGSFCFYIYIMLDFIQSIILCKVPIATTYSTACCMTRAPNCKYWRECHNEQLKCRNELGLSRELNRSENIVKYIIRLLFIDIGHCPERFQKSNFLFTRLLLMWSFYKQALFSGLDSVRPLRCSLVFLISSFEIISLELRVNLWEKESLYLNFKICKAPILLKNNNYRSKSYSFF